MLSPLDLEKQQFETARIGGYKKAGVEEAFNLFKNEYEVMYKEFIAMKDKLSVLNDLVQKYKSMEDALQNALLSAQTTGDELLKNARAEAELIVREAQLKARDLYAEGERRLAELSNRRSELLQSIKAHGIKTVALLNAQIEIVNDMTKENQRSEDSGLRANIKPAEDGLSDEGKPPAEGTGDFEAVAGE